jgi:serine/threonine protein kinase
MSPLLRTAPGQTLEGRFLLLEEIARQEMSTVYKAKDLGDGGRLVAVKVPSPRFSSGLGAWSMFQREAEIGARLHHPCIVRFVSFERNTRGLVVTEYIDGRPLAARIGKGRGLPEAEALRIASRLCEAVDYLHGVGIVHYDLKPGNVMVCGDGSIRLIDFGLAHAVERRRFALSGPAPAVATAAYAAPEQIRRLRGRASVDIYALGAILYEMLTGHPPHEGDDAFSVGSARLIGDPKAPRALNPAVSIEAEEIVLRALRRDPKERHASAAEFKAELDCPAQARMTGLAARLVEVTPWRKRRRWIAYAALVGLAPIASLVGSFVLLWWYFAHRR